MFEWSKIQIRSPDSRSSYLAGRQKKSLSFHQLQPSSAVSQVFCGKIRGDGKDHELMIRYFLNLNFQFESCFRKKFYLSFLTKNILHPPKQGQGHLISTGQECFLSTGYIVYQPVLIRLRECKEYTIFSIEVDLLRPKIQNAYFQNRYHVHKFLTT